VSLLNSGGPQSASGVVEDKGSVENYRTALLKLQTISGTSRSGS
jgi:hypothetical protein